MGFRGGGQIAPPPAYPEFEVPQHAGIGLKNYCFLLQNFTGQPLSEQTNEINNFLRRIEKKNYSNDQKHQKSILQIINCEFVLYGKSDNFIESIQKTEKL